MTGRHERIGSIVSLAAGLLSCAFAAGADDGTPAPARDETPEPAAAVAASTGEAEAPPADARRTALVSRMVLKVVNPEDARAKLSAAAREAGGFPVLVTDDRLEVRVLPGKLEAFLAQAGGEGLVLEKTLERQDLTLEIAQLAGQLEAKRAVLSKLRGFFDDSNVQGTLRIEQTMTELVAEIEQVKGRLRVLEDRARFALVEISFRFKQRDRLIYVHSPFEWLNTVNLDRFLGEF